MKMRPLGNVVIVTFITNGFIPEQEGEIKVTSTMDRFPLTIHRYKTREERVEFLQSLQSRLDKDGLECVETVQAGFSTEGSQIIRVYVERLAPKQADKSRN